MEEEEELEIVVERVELEVEVERSFGIEFSEPEVGRKNQKAAEEEEEEDKGSKTIRIQTREEDLEVVKSTGKEEGTLRCSSPVVLSSTTSPVSLLHPLQQHPSHHHHHLVSPSFESCSLQPPLLRLQLLLQPRLHSQDSSSTQPKQQQL